MRYMYLVKSCQSGMPPKRLFEELDKLAAKAVKSGAMIDSGGLMPLQMGDIVGATGDEVIQANDIDIAGQESLRNMRADEPRPTG